MNEPSQRPPRLALLLLGLAATFALAACDRFMNAEDLVARAERQYAAGNFNAAMQDAKTALDSDPQNVAGRVLLARLALRLGDVKSARSELDRAVAAGASGAAVREFDVSLLMGEGRAADALGILGSDTTLESRKRLALQASAQIDLGQLDAAGVSIEAARGLDAADPEVSLIYGRWLWANGDLEGATRELDALLERKPDAARAALYRARLAMAVGDASMAAASFDATLDAGSRELTIPEQALALSGLVESRLALGDSAGAERELARLSARAPDAYVTRYLKARLAYARGDFATATTELQWALATNPDDPSGRLLLGAVLLEQGSHEQAETTLSQLLSEYPGAVEARKLLARVYLARDDTVAARKVLADAPPEATRDAGADWLSGSILLMGGDTQEAIAMLEQGAAADPTNVPLKLDLARAYLMAGNRDEAVALLQALPAGEGGRRRAELEVVTQAAGKGRDEARAAIVRLAAERPNDAELQTMGGAWLLASGGAAADGRYRSRGCVVAQGRRGGAG
jgi:thioredoxin-like negative regulator of GroEL